MQEHILNVIGLQQMLRKQGSICINICELSKLHKAQKSFQLQDFQGVFKVYSNTVETKLQAKARLLACGHIKASLPCSIK